MELGAKLNRVSPEQQLVSREPVFLMDGDGNPLTTVAAAVGGELLKLTVGDFRALPRDEQERLVLDLDPHLYAAEPRSSWSFESGRTFCEIRGCGRPGYALVGSNRRRRFVICDSTHEELVDAGRYVRGPRARFEEFTVVVRLMREAEPTWNPAWEVEDGLIGYLCAIEGCPALGDDVWGSCSFCFWHEDACDDNIAALFSCQSCGAWNPPPVDLASRPWPWPLPPPVRREPIRRMELVWGFEGLSAMQP